MGLFFNKGATVPLTNREYDKFCRFNWAHTDLNVDLTSIDEIAWVGFSIAFYIKCFFRSCTEKGSRAPNTHQV